MTSTRILLACALLAAPVLAPAQTQVFEDVSTTDPYYATTAFMYERGITSGCYALPLRYCPTAALTRGAASVFIIRSIYSALNGNGDNFPFSQTPYFTDVPATHPQFPYIQKMKELGITQGCQSDKFCLRGYHHPGGEHGALFHEQFRGSGAGVDLRPGDGFRDAG
jgi:hypothetical protein